MTARIFSCGESLNNYNKCLEYSVVGFKKKFTNPGETIYYSMKANKKEGLTCGARGVVEGMIEFSPWAEAAEYLYWYKVSNIELCKPFSLKVLSVFDNWSARFVQLPKPITDINVLAVLEGNFNNNKLETDFIKDQQEYGQQQQSIPSAENQFPNKDVKITKTYRTVNFINETHKIKGLETLVNNNFHRLFNDDFLESDTILIPANRLFKTSNKDTNDNKVDGVSGIPDGLLIRFSKNSKEPIQINILEYECYGETKQKSVQKFNHLNGHIIPQLIRFASAFSIVTDSKIRDENIREWIEKIIAYVEEKELDKVSRWLNTHNSNIALRRHIYAFEKLLIEAFRKSLKILLIIDELSSEQKETIKNVINSFKLEDGKFIEFVSYSVQLVESLDSQNDSIEYALTIQK